jgi:hypothetical protein
VELEGFPQIGERLFLGFALAGNVELEALRDEPVSFAPCGGGEWFFHSSSVTQRRAFAAVGFGASVAL